MKFKKGDEIIVTLGKDQGKKGKIEAIFPKEGKALVNGVNVYKRHTKPQGEDKKGGIIDLPKPLSFSKMSLLCPKCSKPTRIGYQIGLKSKTKIRICRKCKGTI